MKIIERKSRIILILTFSFFGFLFFFFCILSFFQKVLYSTCVSLKSVGKGSAFEQGLSARNPPTSSSYDLNCLPPGPLQFVYVNAKSYAIFIATTMESLFFLPSSFLLPSFFFLPSSFLLPSFFLPSPSPPPPSSLLLFSLLFFTTKL